MNWDARNLREVVTAMEVELGWEREMTMVMEESLWDDEMALQQKLQQHSTLMADKERMLADIETKEKFIVDFMVFIEAVENKDLEKAQQFDEKEMMDAVVTSMTNGQGNYGGNCGGFDCFFGTEWNKLEMGQILDEESMVVLVQTVVGTQAIEGTESGGGCGSEGSNAGGNSTN
ncbi:keratin, type I cuticular Ha4 [Corchorus capsularis]|uniref:Keratin, type I cuticular Ha4 n=1 Tax=Corchorus capsularis TaxID=210143 RepID=A0A1R3KB39_COCAP|nr:keratin, type I cuticular Ha4 [Corchorus capsularis]